MITLILLTLILISTAVIATIVGLGFGLVFLVPILDILVFIWILWLIFRKRK